MHTQFTRVQFKIHAVKLSQRLPEISIDDLATMLEIDAILGRKDDLSRRLQRALDDAGYQGSRIKRIGAD